MTFFYVLLAFIVGLAVGWYLWGRLRDEVGSIRSSLASVSVERDRLKADIDRVNGELQACGAARADLERQLERKDPSAAPAALMAVPAKETGKTAAVPKTAAKPTKPAQAKSIPVPKATAPAKPVDAKVSASTSAKAAKAATAASASKSASPANTTTASKKAASAATKPAKAATAISASKAASPAKLASTKAKAPAKADSKPKVASASKADDLRRLIGIGPVNARKLKSHGITTYAQIASWTAADIRRVEEYLEFDGRIEREKWVEQAKLLAAGNEKEFDRRFPTARSESNS
ncbi:MAG: proton-conducting membrane transporter [Rhizobiaceae bacterium]|nr:proton-conducting membrane transporter [Rhizobiaceae bacterium]